MPQIDKQTSVGGSAKGKPGGVLSRIKPIKQTVGALRMSLYGRPKCLGKGTLVMMFDGTIKAVEDVEPDEVDGA